MAASRTDAEASLHSSTGAAAGSDVLQLHVFADTHARLSTSLAVHAYLRAAGIPYEIIHARYPVYASVGDLPCIMHKSVAVGATGCIDYLKRVVDIDDWLDERGRADAAAYSSLVTHDLFHAEVHAATHATPAIPSTGAGGDKRKAKRLPRRPHNLVADMTNSMPIPLRWFVPAEVSRRVAGATAVAGITDDATFSAALSRAYSSLAGRLAASPGPFMLGDRPSSLDCIVFGHLAAIRSGELGAWIRAHPHTHGLIHLFKATATRLFGSDGTSLPPLHEHALVVRSWGVNQWEAEERDVYAKHAPAQREEAPQQQSRENSAGFGASEDAHAAARGKQDGSDSDDSLLRVAVTLGIGVIALLLLREAAARKWV